MSKATRVTVLGDGGWGTALALVNVRKGNDVVLWSAFPDYAKVLEETRENSKFLPGIPLPKELKIESDLKAAIAHGDILISAIPTQFVRNVLYKVKDVNFDDKILVSVSKGIEKKTHLRPSEIFHSVLGKKLKLAVLCGPSHAEEVARGVPTLVVVAAPDEKVAEKVQKTMMDTYFRVYVQTDLVGVELGGCLKNVIAIAAGVSDGLGFGDNTKSGLISRGLLEMARLGIRLGANPNTFYGLSGMGDLVTTCFSEHGRNLRVGRELGKGQKIKEILGGMEMVAEGVDSTDALHDLCRRSKLELPIVGEVYNILFKDKDPRKAVEDLLNRDAHEEWKQY